MALDNGNAAVRQPRRRRSPTASLNAARRAVIGACLTSGASWTVRDASELCCVSVGYVTKVRQMSEADRFRLLRGEISLAQLCNGKPPKPKPTLADMLTNASPGERASAAARLGVATVWDEMVAPLIDQERATQAAG
jgi:hypothetical protein